MEEECQSTVGKIISVPAGTVSAIASCTHQTSQDTAHKLLGSCGWESLGACGAVRLGAVGRGGGLWHDEHRRLGLVDGLWEVPGADLAEAAVVGRGDEAVVPIVHLAPQDMTRTLSKVLGVCKPRCGAGLHGSRRSAAWWCRRRTS